MTPARASRGLRSRAGAGSVGLLGVVGSVACTAAMVAPVIGAVGAGAAASTGGMEGMTGPARGGLFGFLIDCGPFILVASIVLVTVSVALRRPAAALPALAAGALLYWGMYAQPSLPVMYLTLALGFAGWAAAYLWTRTATSPQLTS